MGLLRRKKSDTTINRRPQLARSVPVDRYYSGMSHRQTPNTQKRRILQEDGSDRSRVVRKRQSSIWVHLLVKWCGVLGIVSVLLFNVTLNQVGVKIGLSDFGKSGTLYRTEEEYVRQAQEAFRAQLLSRSKLTFSANEYEQLLQASLPEIERAVAVVPLVGTRLQVGFALTEPLVYAPEIGKSGTVIGTNGRVIAVTDKSILDRFASSLPKVYVETPGTVEDGAFLLTSGEVELIEVAKSEFDGSSIDRPKISSIRYIIAKRELQISFSDKSYFAKLTTERDARAQVGAVVATLRSVVGGGGEAPVEYIDVRVEGRAFLK